MRNEFDQLRGSLFFTAGDLARILGIERRSAWVLCCRRVKTGRFIRLKNNFYILDETWRSMTRDGFYRVANFLQVPSYVSLLTALSYYEATTQVTRNHFESVSLKRSAVLTAGETEFRYRRLKKSLYFGFENKNGFFVATREKALADAIYLCSIGKYKLDCEALEMTKFDLHELSSIMKRFPGKARMMMESLWKN